MSESLETAIARAGDAFTLLWESQLSPGLIPRVQAEFSNWIDEQLATHETAVLYDQSHHMTDLNLKGPDALKVIRALAVNSVENFPVDMAKQFIAVNEDGHFIGDCILFHLDDDEYQAVGMPESVDWLHYHAVTGGYDVAVWRDENSGSREGDPRLYRYEVQGPNAMDVMRDAIGEEPPVVKFFRMTSFTIAGKHVRALRHGMAGEPGFELWGPWEDHEDVHAALLKAGRRHQLVQVGGRAYPTNALDSGWMAAQVPAIYTGDHMADYRRWLAADCWEAQRSLGGSYNTGHMEDYYFNPYELGYQRVISFDHDFIGRAALERMVAEGETEARRKVTLVWNGDDAGAAMASLFQPGRGAKYCNLPMARYNSYQYDRVEVDGKLVGLATYTGYVATERAMLSLAVVDAEFAEPGTEVSIVWGESPNSTKPPVEEHTQVTIRAIVQPAPLTRKARTTYRAD